MILVTGGTGLVGSYLLLELAKKGKKVKAIYTQPHKLEAVKNLFKRDGAGNLFDSIEWVIGDLLDFFSLEKALMNVNTVYHLAGYIDFNEKNSEKLFEINVVGTTNLMNACISSTVKNVIFTSSIATLDPSPNKDLITEQTNWNNEAEHSTYAITKRKAEMEVWRASQEGLNVAVVYPSIIIGSLDGKRESEKLFKLALRKNSYTTSGTSGFVDVYDVANCMVLIQENKLYQESYILSANNKSYQEVFNFLRKTHNLKPARLVKKSILWWAYKLSFIIKLLGVPGLSKPTYYTLVSDLSYSNKKICKALNYTFKTAETALTEHSKNYIKNLKE